MEILQKFISNPNMIMATTSLFMVLLVGFQVYIAYQQNRLLKAQIAISKILSRLAIFSEMREHGKTFTDELHKLIERVENKTLTMLEAKTIKESLDRLCEKSNQILTKIIEDFDKA